MPIAGAAASKPKKIEMKTAYIYTTGNFSGAAMSLVQVLKRIKGEAEPVILVPRGSASAFFRSAGIGTVHEVAWLSQFDHTRYGRYRGLRWLIALRELLLLPYTFLAIRGFAAKHRDVELIHLNEITGILGAVLLKRLLNVPLVVHIRAHMGEQGKGLRSRFLWRFLFERHVDRIVCIDETVRSTVPADTGIPVVTIHNALDLGKAGHAEPRPLPDLMEQPNGLVRVGIVGSLLPVKGVYEFFDAAVRLLQQRDDLVFIYVGKGVRQMSGPIAAIYKLLKLADNTEENLKNLVAQSGHGARILMLGHRDDLHHIYHHLDMLCFPSHYNAPGRPIFEAGYFGKPSIVAIDNPMPDTLVDGVTGIAIKAKDPQSLAAAIARLADNPAERTAMGGQAQALAQRNFDLQHNAERLLALYRELVPATQAAAIGQAAR